MIEEDDEIDEPEPEWESPPALLLESFRELETLTDIAVLLVEDGFDAVTMRVLSAWEKTEHRWRRPETDQPADRPTVAVWEWLASGWCPDYAAIAAGADVSHEIARERFQVLMRARLIYPDGTMSEHATKALEAVVRLRLRAEGQRAKKQTAREDKKTN
jgi:hypothetical protein